MAFTQFPHQQYFRILETDTTTGLGYFNLSAATQLQHMMFTIFVKGVIPSAFTARVRCYPTSALTTAIFSSSYATISTATLNPTYVTNWLGNIYFDFDGNPLNPNLDYYFAIETVGYTRNGESYYVGVNLDWYSPVNNQLSATDAAARIRILGLR